MRKNIIVAMASLAFLPAVSFAAAPTLGEVLDASGIAVTGHASGSYAYSRNSVNTLVITSGGGVSFVPTGAPGAYTGQSNSFTFNQAELSISKLPAEGFGAAVDVIGGQDASKLNNFAGGSDFNLHQAYVQYATGGLAVMAGKYAGLAGSEVVSDNLNSNVTRSLLFNFQPVTVTGVRGSYKFNNMITVIGGVNNSAGGATQDANKQKSVEASVALAPVTGLTINLTDYYGNESTAGSTGGNSGDSSNLIDLVAGYTLGDLSLGLNADHAKAIDKNAFASGVTLSTKVDGVALYGNYQITKALRAGLRGEWVKTVYSASGTSFNKQEKEVTLTADYAFSKNFDLLAEARYDRGDYNQGGFSLGGFVDNAGNPANTDTTFAVKAIYKF